MKTGSIQEPLKPIKRMEIEAMERHQAQQKKFEASELDSKVRRKDLEKEIRRLIRVVVGDRFDARDTGRRSEVDRSEGGGRPQAPTHDLYADFSILVEVAVEGMSVQGPGLRVVFGELNSRRSQRIDLVDLHSAETSIRASLEEMRALAADAEPQRDDFAMTADLDECTRCGFRRICGR